MKGKTLFGRLALFMILLCFAFTGCGSGGGDADGDAEAGEEAPATDAEAETETVADDTVYTLKLNYFSSENIPPGQACLQAAEKAAELSDGRLQIECYFSGTLVAYEDQMMSLSNGVIDIGLFSAGQFSQLYTLNQVFTRPYTVTPKSHEATRLAYQELVRTVPEINEELSANNMKWLGITCLNGYNYHGKEGKTVKTPADLKGLKVESLGDTVEYVSAMGAAPQSLDPGDFYTAFERGQIEGQFTHWAVMNNFKINELVKTHTIFGADPENYDAESGGLWTPLFGWLINLNTYNSLPPDLQKALNDAFQYASEWHEQTDAGSSAEGLRQAKEWGHEIVVLTPEETKPFYDYAAEVNKAWFEKCAAAGYDGEGIYNKLMDLHRNYNESL
ncbi:MAG: TRAP transporter substrate-binding protein DctP [Clostridiales Family XIII bacterium]|jgi:TRAP-type C4-dicarboxylate transport system substrate-binding protein|nr:TRAP transporter substrate-binding protein DctP [Clostridiales Family XIII bacterium]